MASRKPLTTASPRPTPVRRTVGAARVEPLERLEHPLLALVRHAPAVIDDLQQHACPPSWLARSCGRPPGRRVGQRVGEQVGQHPLQQAGVGAHQRQPVRAQPSACSLPRSRPRSATGATSSTAVGRRNGCSDPVASRLMSSRLPISASSRSADVLDGGQQRCLVRRGPLHVGLPQRADAGLDRGQRGAQVVADRGEQRGPHPVALGQRLGLGGLGTQPVPVQRRADLGGEAVQQPARQRPVLAGRLPAPGRRSRGRACSAGVVRARLPLDRGAHPLLADRSSSSARPPRLLVRWPSTAVGRVRRRRARSAPVPAALRPRSALRAACTWRRAARCTTLLTVTATVTNSSRASRLRGSAMVSVCSGGVKYQFSSRLAASAASTRGPEAAHDRDGHHGHQVDQQVVGQVQVRPRGGQDDGQQRQPDSGQQHPGQPAACHPARPGPSRPAGLRARSYCPV